MIDLDKIRTRGKGCKILKTELDRRYKQDACLYCRKQGHRQDTYLEKKSNIKVLVIRLVLTRLGRA